MKQHLHTSSLVTQKHTIVIIIINIKHQATYHLTTWTHGLKLMTWKQSSLSLDFQHIVLTNKPNAIVSLHGLLTYTLH
jgi:hypothetical protein